MNAPITIANAVKIDTPRRTWSGIGRLPALISAALSWARVVNPLPRIVLRDPVARYDLSEIRTVSGGTSPLRTPFARMR